MALNFRKVTDELFSKIGAEEFAKEAGCSLQSIKQARMESEAAGRRAPPPGWEKAALRLAEKQGAHFAKLIAKLRASE